jgi:hypothetical protein
MTTLEPAPVTTANPYEAPAVETVLTADDLARDVQYAGDLSER